MGRSVPSAQTVITPALVRLGHGHVEDDGGDPGGRQGRGGAGDLSDSVPPRPTREPPRLVRVSSSRVGVTALNAPTAVGVPLR